jgi:hypothetical protein
MAAQRATEAAGGRDRRRLGGGAGPRGRGTSKRRRSDGVKAGHGTGGQPAASG